MVSLKPQNMLATSLISYGHSDHKAAEHCTCNPNRLVQTLRSAHQTQIIALNIKQCKKKKKDPVGTVLGLYYNCSLLHM